VVRSSQCPAELSRRYHLAQVLKKTSPFPFCSYFSSEDVKKGPGAKVPSVEAAKQVAREDLSVAKAKAPSARNSQRRKTAPALNDLPSPFLIALPGNESRATPPTGEVIQGPSLVDYNMEIAADFPLDMVLKMQRNAAKKARRTVIGKTLGGKATFKALRDCFKLHLLAPFSTVTLLTRDYFEILFKDEEGAKATRKLAAVE
jgi:hypothetical protein